MRLTISFNECSPSTFILVFCMHHVGVSPTMYRPLSLKVGISPVGSYSVSCRRPSLKVISLVTGLGSAVVFKCPSGPRGQKRTPKQVKNERHKWTPLNWSKTNATLLSHACVTCTCTHFCYVTCTCTHPPSLPGITRTTGITGTTGTTGITGITGTTGTTGITGTTGTKSMYSICICKCQCILFVYAYVNVYVNVFVNVYVNVFVFV